MQKELSGMDVFSQLREPFPYDDLEWRIQRAGKKGRNVWAIVLAYVTARGVEDRLDYVVGPMNWWDIYEPGPAGGVRCSLTLRIDGKEITKQGMADNTKIEAVKGGESDSLKRAAVKFGIARYLYYLEGLFAIVHSEGDYYQPAKKNTYEAFRWSAPELPKWALPGGEGRPSKVLRAEMARVARQMSDDSPEVLRAINNPTGRGVPRTKLVNAAMNQIKRLPERDRELWEDKIRESGSNEALISLGLEIKALADEYPTY